MEAVELTVETRLLAENSHNGQHLEQVLGFGEALFLSHLNAGYHVNCVPNGSWVHCGDILNATQSGKLNDNCATVIYIQNKE